MERLLLTEKEAAEMIGLTPRFLQNRRTRGDSPRFVRISARCVRYRASDIVEWAEQRLHSNTSEQ
jgi:predicted DNA-binding transcriptional regulator AlpA